MHGALAKRTEDPRFDPEPLTRDDLRLAVSRARTHAERTLDSLAAMVASPSSKVPTGVVERARLILDVRNRVIEPMIAAADLDPTSMRIRIHGDYRLGQVLLGEGDISIQNYEGHPAWPATAQREKQSLLRDVASMLRSFSYAAHAALLTRTTATPDRAAHLGQWSKAWDNWTKVSFLRAYDAVADAAGSLPASVSERDTLLRFFMIDRAMRELDGELNNRPEWIGIPIGGLLDLLGLE
jgi:maltose alpha-D-glucosyltransferase/alpha-amylase